MPFDTGDFQGRTSIWNYAKQFFANFVRDCFVSEGLNRGSVNSGFQTVVRVWSGEQIPAPHFNLNVPQSYLCFTSIYLFLTSCLPQFNLCSAGNLEPRFGHHGLGSCRAGMAWKTAKSRKWKKKRKSKWKMAPSWTGAKMAKKWIFEGVFHSFSIFGPFSCNFCPCPAWGRFPFRFPFFSISGFWPFSMPYQPDRILTHSLQTLGSSSCAEDLCSMDL